TIARNRCLSLLSARCAVEALDVTADTAYAPASAEDAYAAVERRAEVDDLLDDLRRLPEEQRTALALFELGGHTQDEIAAVLGVPRARVKALVFQAREGLFRARRARAAACLDIVAELATLSGKPPRRGPIAAHLARCESCSDFAAEVSRQRAAFAGLVPVA